MASVPPQETLLSPSNILLYGRTLSDLTFTHQPPGDAIPTSGDNEPPRLGDNNFLQKQLAAGANFARIYAFAYEGHYYDLPKPVIFLVHGAGTPSDGFTKPTGVAQKSAHEPPSVSHVGAAKTSVDSTDDLMVWSYDKSDISLRLDTESGKLEDILLEATLGPPDGGAHMSGARVSGARVSGARVSGARVSGARVGGSGSD
jgi:hypothetical protein